MKSYYIKLVIHPAELSIVNSLEDEFSQFLGIARNKGVSPNLLLEEKLQPFQEKIRQRDSELIAAITREWDSTGSSTPPRRPQSYTIEETLYVGVITQDTHLLNPLEEDFCLKTQFMENVKTPCKKRDIDDLFCKLNSNSFESFRTPITLVSLYFSNKPPTMPQDADESTIDLANLFKLLPRLEIYIGNREVLPMLEKLYSYQFMQLSRLLERSLPLSEAMAEKVKKEQISLYREIVEAEKEIIYLEGVFQKRIEAVRSSGGAIYHPTHVEVTDEDVEKLNYRIRGDEKFSRVLGLVQTAALRNYHNDGISCEIREDKGVTTSLNLKDFFIDRIQKYEVKTAG